MRLLITGGMGFIGAAVVRRMLAAGHHVLNLDKLTYAASPERLADVLPHPRHEFTQATVNDASALRDIFARFDPDAVLHLAAESHIDRSIYEAADFIQSNIVGSYTLLEAARRYSENLAPARRAQFRFHLVSTDEVYGALGPEGVFTETSPYAPNSPYSASKAAADMLARAWRHTYGLPVIVSNCSNNYGPWQHPEKLIPTILIAAMEQRPIPIYGDGSNIRDWLHVEDHAAALQAILERGRIGETYNVGGEAERTNLAMAQSLCSLLDEKAPHAAPHARLISFVGDRPGHDWRYAIDAGKIRHELGWRPTVALDDGLRSTVRWYLQNRAWWEHLAGATR
jgi:dTDP-glucose 4,6-dehydratase